MQEVGWAKAESRTYAEPAGGQRCAFAHPTLFPLSSMRAVLVTVLNVRALARAGIHAIEIGMRGLSTHFVCTGLYLALVLFRRTLDVAIFEGIALPDAIAQALVFRFGKSRQA